MTERRRLLSDLPPVPRMFPRWNHATLLLLGIALVARIATGLVFNDKLKQSIVDDPDGYVKLAENLKNFQVYGSAKYVPNVENPDGPPQVLRRPKAYRPPLYPWLLRLTSLRNGQLSATRVLALHVILGVATSLIVWQLALRCGLGAWSFVAVLVTIFDPILLNQSAQVMTETVATFLAATCLWCLLRRMDHLKGLYWTAADHAEERGDEAEDGEIGEGDEPQDHEAAESDEHAQREPSEPSRSTRRARRREQLPLWLRTDDTFWLGLIRFDVLAGVLLGLAALCRPTFFAWIALLLIVEVVRNVYRDRYPVLFHTMILCVSLGLTLSPWMARNARVLGKATPTTTHGGYTLLLGNNEQFYEFLEESPPGGVWSAARLDAQRTDYIRTHNLSEVEADRDSYGQALEAISKNPGMFAYSCFVRLGRFWAPMPHRGTVKLGGEAKNNPEAATSDSNDPLTIVEYVTPEESTKEKFVRRGTAIWYDAILVLVLLGATVVARRRLSGPWLEGFLLVIALSIVHTIFWSNMRMRAPLTPFLALLVAAGLTLFFSRDDELDLAPKRSD